MTPRASIDRAWIAAELAKGIDAERSLATEAQARAHSPPAAVLSVLYHEIASADLRHAAVVETIAARYGHTPSASPDVAIGRALVQLRNKVIGGPSDGCDQLIHDLAVKARSIHWLATWVHTFEAIGDSESARELSAILAEEQAHRDALQTGLNREVEQHARGASEHARRAMAPRSAHQWIGHRRKVRVNRRRLSNP
jgi:hypothetical protein